MQGLNHDERLIWLLQTILKEQVSLPYSGSCSMVELDKLQVAPHLDDSDQAECFSILDEVINDKDFYRKHNMLNYKPSYSFDYSRTYSSNDVAVFCDFTDDLIKTYLKDKLDVKGSTATNGNFIKKIEVLKDETERGRVKIYINGNYKDEPMNLSRNNRWGLIYKLAKKEEVPFDKNLYDYFNYQQTNPLYTKGFQVTKILREEDGYIVPNIQIKLITKNKTTRQLKSA
jgi:hypothetical protein